MNRALLALLMALVLGGLPASVTAQPTGYVEPANLNALVAAAAKEGTLDLAAGSVFGGSAGAKLIQAAIDKKYHINLTINYTLIAGGVQFVQQLVQEVHAGQPASSDILFSTFGVPAAIQYVQPVDYRKYIPGLPESVMYFNHHSAAVYASLQGYDYNTKLVSPSDVPKSFYDLLKPMWKGRIASSAYQGNFISYIGLPSVMGHQGMIDFITKFSSQVGGLFPCGEIDRVVSGEFWLFGVDCGDYEVRKRQRKGEPIAEMYPKEGTMLTYLDPSIPLTAVHPAAARLFVTFLLTRDGQDLLWNVAGTDNDRLPGSHMAPIIAVLRRQGVKLVDGMTTPSLPEISTYAKEIGAIINQGR